MPRSAPRWTTLPSEVTMQPKPTLVTFRPVLPRVRYSNSMSEARFAGACGSGLASETRTQLPAIQSRPRESYGERNPWCLQGYHFFQVPISYSTKSVLFLVGAVAAQAHDCIKH